MKNYIRPEMTISLYKIENIIAVSGAVQLTNDGENGLPMKGKFSDMFGAGSN